MTRPPPAAVFLDLGNVVVRWHPERLCANLARLAQSGVDRVAAVLATSPLDPAYVEGRIDTAAFRDGLGAALGVRFEATAFAAAWTGGGPAPHGPPAAAPHLRPCQQARGRRSEPEASCRGEGSEADLPPRTEVFERDPAMEALVDELASVVPTYALSNTNALHFEWLTAHVPVLAAFRAVVASHLVGAQKPDPRVYAHAAAVAGHPGEALLFVDDLPANVAGARAAGWRAWPFTGEATLRRALAQAGVPIAVATPA